jgi:MFS family permease
MTDPSTGGFGASDDGAFASLRFRSFRALWTASLFSKVGTFFQITAGSWLMWEMTGSPVWVGWMAASRNLPLLVLALPAGMLADRFDRATLVRATQTGMGLVAATMAVLMALGWMTPPILLTLGIMLGIGVAFDLPAWHTLMPDLVPRSMHASAVALNSVSGGIARTVGPVVAGVIVATFGAGLAFGLNFVSYIGIIAALILTGRTLADRDRDRTSAIRAMATGVRFARHTRAFRRLLILGALFALSSAVVLAMLPVRTVDLGQGVGAYGVLLGSFGAGSAIGGASMTRAIRWLGVHSIPWAIVLFGVVGVLAGLAPSAPLLALPMLLAGVFWVWTVATINATIQIMAPDWVRGRAISLWLVSYAGVVPFGAVIAGLTAQQFGAGAAVIALSLVTVMVGVGARMIGVQDPLMARTPEFTSAAAHHHHPPAEGGPVMILNMWRVAPDDVAEFLEEMRQVRLLRLRTGGYRWQMYQQVGAENVFNETFLVPSWHDHLAQHGRIDDASFETLLRVRRLDSSSSGPVARHLMAVDVMGEPPLDRQTQIEFDLDHRVMHTSDGSVPIASSDDD